MLSEKIPNSYSFQAQAAAQLTLLETEMVEGKNFHWNIQPNHNDQSRLHYPRFQILII